MVVYKILGVLGIVLALSTCALAGPIYSDGLIAYYSFDNAGNLGADGSVHGYNGTVAGALAGATGKLGGAANFTQTSSPATQYIDLPVADIIAGGDSATSNFTLAAWYYLVPNTYDQTIMSARCTGTGSSGMCIHAELRPNNSDYKWTVRNATGTTIGSIDPDILVPAQGSWHHVAYTYDKAAAKLSIYVDGEFGFSDSVSLADDMAAWDVGARIGATANDATRPYTGMMDELYLFKRTLSADEIGTLASVPEPSSIGLLICAALSSLFFWRKWKR